MFKYAKSLFKRYTRQLNTGKYDEFYENNMKSCTYMHINHHTEICSNFLIANYCFRHVT